MRQYWRTRWPSRCSLADQDLLVADELVRRHDQVGRRRNALEHAPGDVVARLVARTVEADLPDRIVRIGHYLRDERGRAPPVRADADHDKPLRLLLVRAR